MVEISTNLKHISKKIDEMSTKLDGFTETREDVIKLKLEVEDLKQKVNNIQPNNITNKHIAAGAGAGGVIYAIAEVIRYLIGL
jgi:uncharacterized protein YoxC